MNSTCPSCGARVSAEQSHCDLCGTVLRASDDADGPERGGMECPVCGSVNPEGSRFCNQCGSKIQNVRSAGSLADLPSGSSAQQEESEETASDDESQASEEDDGMAKRVLYTVGAGVLLMMVLYGVTLLSSGQYQDAPDPSERAAVTEEASPPGGGGESSAPDAPSETSAAESLSGEVAEEVESLEESIAAATRTSERVDLQQDLVRVYAQAERQDLAGEVQEEIAETEQTAAAWADAGNLYYDWMMQRQSRPEQTQYAKKAIEAYQKSLDIDPTNLDVRTDMAVAYLYDPDNPMQAIKQTQRVLEEDPDHIQANFNRGIMLLRINRVEEAIQQFERVKRLADAGSPVYERTEQVLEQIHQQQQ